METWSKALGVQCDHCHIEGDYTVTFMQTYDMAYRMNKMVETLNAGPLQGYGGVTCFTCHRGSPTPPKITREQWEAAAKPYEKAFAGDNSMALQMGVFTASLGAPCTECHVEGDYGSDDNPKKLVGRRMRGMVGSIPKQFAGTKVPEISCYSCHQGQLRPVR
jgi:hypothetical protein